MTHPRLLPLLALAALTTLGGCAAHSEHDKGFVAVADRVYKNATVDFMYTMAQRTKRDMTLTGRSSVKDPNGAFLVVEVPQTDFGEMGIDIRPAGDHDTRVTLFSHNPRDTDAATHILDDLTHQIAVEKSRRAS